MATKKTETTKAAPKLAKAPAKTTTAKGTKAGVKVAKAPKAEGGPVLPRHPHGRVVARHTSKEALAKAIASAVARADEDTGVIAERLGRASNSQLLRLNHVVETVKSKYGNRDKLIAAIGTTEKKSKDKDFLAKLDSCSLPQLLELARSAERRA